MITLIAITAFSNPSGSIIDNATRIPVNMPTVRAIANNVPDEFDASFDTAIKPAIIVMRTPTLTAAWCNLAGSSILLKAHIAPTSIKIATDIFINILPALDEYSPDILDTPTRIAIIMLTTPANMAAFFRESFGTLVSIAAIPTKISKAIDIFNIIEPALPACSPANLDNPIITANAANTAPITKAICFIRSVLNDVPLPSTSTDNSSSMLMISLTLHSTTNKPSAIFIIIEPAPLAYRPATDDTAIMTANAANIAPIIPAI